MSDTAGPPRTLSPVRERGCPSTSQSPFTRSSSDTREIDCHSQLDPSSPAGLLPAGDRFQDLLHELGREHEEAIRVLNEELQEARSANQLTTAGANMLHRVDTSKFHRADDSTLHRADASLLHRADASVLNRADSSMLNRGDTMLAHRHNASVLHRPYASMLHRADASTPHRAEGGMLQRAVSDASLSQRATASLSHAPKIATSPKFSASPIDEREEPPTRQVEVTFFSGHNLKNADISWLGQKSDPYCMCYWKSDPHGKWRTPVMKNNLNPIWNHTIDIGSCRFDDELHFSVWDEDALKKDDLLGRVSLPTYIFCSSGFEGSLPLKDAKGRIYGELRLKIAIREPATHFKTSQRFQASQLNASIHASIPGATDLSDTSHALDDAYTSWRWEALVGKALDSVSCEMRWPRPVWSKSAAVGFQNKFLAKQATQRLTEVVHNAKHFDRKSLAGPERRTTFLFMEVSWNESRWTAMNPHSRKRIFWALVGLLFMVYDLIMIPMQVFVLPESVLFNAVAWSSQIFWTCDIIVNFFTGVYINSQLHTGLWTVARRYLTTWFLFDITVTIPTYIPLMAQDSELANEATLTQSMRTVRIFRLMRLVRLCKFESQMNETLEVINSEGYMLSIRMLKHNVVLIIWNHIVACAWFFIGDVGKGWIVENEVQGKDFSYRYLTSLHWTLAQYQGNSEIMPTTTTERAYAVFFLQVAMIILAVFVSRLTNMMRQMQELMHDRSARQRSVCAYLSENQISSTLSVRVKKYVEWQRRFERRRKEDEEVLLILPTPILMDLLEEVRAPVLQKHPFFSVFCQEFSRTTRRICHEAVCELTPAPGETVFAAGDVCYQMYFVRCGQLRYIARPRSCISKVQRNYCQSVDQLDREHDLGAGFEKMSLGSKNHNQAVAHVENSERVIQGFWISEAVLWCEWEHCGDLTGLEDNILLSLQYEPFAHIVAAQSTAMVTASLYARRFVAAFDRFGFTFTDLIDHDILFDDSEEADYDCTAAELHHQAMPSLISKMSSLKISKHGGHSSIRTAFGSAAKALNQTVGSALGFNTNRVSELSSVVSAGPAKASQPRLHRISSVNE